MKNTIETKKPNAKRGSLPPTILALAAALICGCSATKPLKGGRASTTPKAAGALEQTLTQSDNPSQSSRQAQDTIKTRTYTLPSGSRIEESQVQALAPGIPVTNTHSTVISAPVPVTEREETHATTQLGAAQKDTTREMAAKLSSLKGIVWVGLGLFIFGLASIFWLPLKTIIGSLTTSIAITLGGVALMILPTLIVGNELLILGAVTVAVGAWFLAHRHGHLRGQVATLTSTKPPAPTSQNQP